MNSGTRVQRCLVLAVLLGASAVAVGNLTSSAGAVPRPEVGSSLNRDCSGRQETQKFLPSDTTFAQVTSCSMTVVAAGTMYLSASSDVHAYATQATADSIQSEFQLTVDGAALPESDRLLGIDTSSTEVDGSNRSMSTQGTKVALSAGPHTLRLIGRINGTHTTGVQLTNAFMSAYFVPDVGDERGCGSVPLTSIVLSPTPHVSITTCTITVGKAGRATLRGSSTVKLGDGDAVGLGILVDGGPVALTQVARKASTSSSARSNAAVVQVVDMTPGTHTIELVASAAGSPTLEEPAIRALFSPTSPPDTTACSEGASDVPVGAGNVFSLVTIFCPVTTTYDSVAHLDAVIDVEANTTAGAEIAFAIEVDGTIETAFTQHKVNVNRVSSTDLDQRVVEVEFDSYLTFPGNHTMALLVKRTSTSGTATLTNVAAVEQIVSDDASTIPTSTAPTTTTTPAPGGSVADYVPVVPDRVLETRVDGQIGYVGDKPAAGQIIQLQVTGTGTSQVPADATAVALNVTGVDATTAGYVTVWPCGSSQPTASNLNLVPGIASPNLVISKIGDGGKVCLFTQASAHLIADINGYMPAGAKYSPVVPERLLDTRPSTQTGYVGDKPAAGATVTLQVTDAGVTDVPGNAKSVVLNLTGTEAEASGFATVWPCGSPRPTASNLNIAAGATSPNLVVSKLGDGGTVCIYTQSAMHLIADVNGFMPSSSSYHPVVPERLLETRADGQTGYSGDKPAAGSTIELTVIGAGMTNVPAGTNAVVLNVTGLEASANGYVTVWPCGATRPTASNLNLTVGGISPNLVMSKVGDGGKVCIYTQSSAQIVADVNGYWP